MMHPAEIRHRSTEAAKKAAAENKEPFVFFDRKEVRACPPFNFPFLGDYEPPGWSQLLEEDLFVDISGVGAPDEPALTVDQLKDELINLLVKHKDETVGFAFSEVGQFQGHLRVYKKEK